MEHFEINDPNKGVHDFIPLVSGDMAIQGRTSGNDKLVIPKERLPDLIEYLKRHV